MAEWYFNALDEVLRGLAAILELTPRISDLIVSYGERLSSVIIAQAFRDKNHLSFDISVDGGVTDETIGPCVTAGANQVVVAWAIELGSHTGASRQSSACSSIVRTPSANGTLAFQPSICWILRTSAKVHG